MSDYTISETYELPSKGLIYDKKVNPSLELRSMTARDEMKRLNPSSTPLKTLADIIEGCIVGDKPAVHVYDMAVGDYEYLLHKLRTVTYGPEYPISVTCPHCEESVDYTAHLDQIEVKPFNQEEFEALRTFTLPKSGKTVTINFQTPRMLDTIDAKAKELKRQRGKTAGINLETYAQLYATIATIDGKKPSSVDFDALLDDLDSADMIKIQNMADKLNAYIGLNNIITFECPKCGEEIITFFRFGPEFFRPSNI